MVQLFVGLKRDPTGLGIAGENLWLFESFDHERVFSDVRGLMNGAPPSCFVSFPSLRDPHAKVHTAEIIAWADREPFAAWSGLPWRRRGVEYGDLKRRIGDGLIAFVESQLPGFAGLVSYAELSTPLTVEHFNNHAGGAVYGFAPTPERFAGDWLSTRTPIRGLLLAGADAGSPGVVGAMMGGFIAAAAAMGPLGFPRILKAARRGRGHSAPDDHALDASPYSRV